MRHGEARPSPEEVSYLEALYDDRIHAWDLAFADLLQGLERIGLRDNTVVVVTADHGEQFMEHGNLAHGKQLFDELLRVPLVIAGPGIPSARSAEPVQQVDLLPTVARLLGADVPAGLPGVDVLSGRLPMGRAAFSEILNGIGPHAERVQLVSRRDPHRKVIWAPSLGHYELFDLDDDPTERNDRFASAPDKSVLQNELSSWWRAHDSPPRSRPGRDDLNVVEKLRTLGYVD
jgi:arylsulfatase A-like enzyme